MRGGRRSCHPRGSLRTAGSTPPREGRRRDPEMRFHAFHYIVPSVCAHFGIAPAPFLEEEVLDSCSAEAAARRGGTASSTASRACADATCASARKGKARSSTWPGSRWCWARTPFPTTLSTSAFLPAPDKLNQSIKKTLKFVPENFHEQIVKLDIAQINAKRIANAEYYYNNFDLKYLIKIEKECFTSQALIGFPIKMKNPELFHNYMIKHGFWAFL